jgi:hypothetical protein
MTSNNRVSQMELVQKEALELFKKKNADYGDAFANYGVIGVLVRMGDKISRLQSITTKQISLVNTESLRDTLIDLHNYSAMAIMLMDEKNKDPPKSIPRNESYGHELSLQDNNDLPYSARWPNCSSPKNTAEPSWPPSVNNR